MKTIILRYNVIIGKEGKHYVSYVPTLGIFDFGKSIEEAQKNTQELIECHIEGLLKTKSEIPAPDNKEFYMSQAEVVVPAKLKFAF